MQKQIQWKIKGMQRDLSESAFNPEYAYENKNIRIMPTDENTLLSLINEKGNKLSNIIGIGDRIEGIPIGQSLLNNELILFTAKDNDNNTIEDIKFDSVNIQDISATDLEIDIQSSEDKIYKLWFNNGTLNGELLFNGKLNLNPSYPIETISVYENDKVKKVYWVDGINQPRVINLCKNYNNSDKFNFSTLVTYNSTITIDKLNSGGNFPSGVIQYVFTYYNLYGQQSSFFHITPLYFISAKDMGDKEDARSSCSFRINIKSLDTSYDYVRIYSIIRTSIDSIPITSIVGEFPTINGEIVFIDKGDYSISVDPSEILFLENNSITASTISYKDNTLFLGNISKLDKNIGPLKIGDTTIKNYSRKLKVYTDYKGYYNDNINSPVENKSDYGTPSFYGYKIDNNRSSNYTRVFKFRETYRLGFIAQSERGKYSEVIWVGDVENDKIPVSDLNEYKTGIFKIDIPKELKYVLLNNGFTRLTPVIVYPNSSDRTILCQGIISPTVYNVEDRYTNSPFVQSSWFFRFTESTMPNCSHGKSFNKNTILGCEIQNIQEDSMYPYISYKEGDNDYKYMTGLEFSSFFKENWFTDASIITLNSPDIECSDELLNESLEGISFRIVGTSELIANRSDIDVTTSTSGQDANLSKFVRYPTNYDNLSTINSNTKRLNSKPLWYDKSSLLFDLDISDKEDWTFGYMIYPWHRNGSLNTQNFAKEGNYKVAQLDKKKISNLLYCNTKYDGNIWEPDNGISTPVIFNSNEVTAIKIKPEDTNNFKSDLTYYGNIDKILTSNLVDISNKTLLYPSPVNEKRGNNKSNGYPICYGFQKYIGNDEEKRNKYNYYEPINKLIEEENFAPTNKYEVSSTSGESTEVYSWSKDSIRMKYKSTPHAVILLNNVESKDSIIPGYGSTFEGSNPPFWRDTDNWGIWSKKWVSSEGRRYLIRVGMSSASSDLIIGTWNVDKGYGFWKSITFNLNGKFNIVFNDSSTDYGTYTYSNNDITLTYSDGVKRIYNIVELNTDNLIIDDTSISPFYSNKILIGELYRKTVYNRFGGTSDSAIASNSWVVCGESIILDYSTNAATLSYIEGDSYFQRYDCLKTYPFTLEDQNSVVEILSTMIETRVNLDERVDKNRGQLSNLTAMPSNFNLFNKIYTQKNNFFNYRALDYSKDIINTYPNTITWTLSKSNGEDIDNWTHITLASTLELDGNKGEIRAIRRFNNNLISFQDRGISQILYNENMQITSTEGVPIEIANSGKVNGKRYLSDTVGCSNKWSICNTPNGIYFIDDITKGIFLFNGKLDNLSDRLGFHSWINSKSKAVNIWNPKDFNGFVTYYDKVNGDVFFISKEECLAFSEPLGQFTSFYSYESMPYFINLEDRGIMINTPYNDSIYKVWLHNEGDYNIFFGEYQPFYTIIIANPDISKDKIFNTLEFRADTWKDSILLNTTFDTLDTWNEYQRGTSTLNTILGKPSNLKKKFRVWRANIPRDNYNKRDRMRNPWLYLKLSMEGENTNKTVLHDMIVHYFE